MNQNNRSPGQESHSAPLEYGEHSTENFG